MHFVLTVGFLHRPCPMEATLAIYTQLATHHILSSGKFKTVHSIVMPSCLAVLQVY